ncbi:MAG: endonuclease/exonuclease/phosphatase family protein [Spirochaetales bacterium]|nr:endonuclease/exonuclease/phosphatase family protein [Spirochaetales bacterium]
MKKTIIIFTVIILLSSCMLCCEENKIIIASYNVDNLFDDIDDGTEYTEFDPGTEKWTHALYQNKLAAILSAIRSIPDTPDILCLQEIENKNVLERIKTVLGYTWSVVPPKPESAATIGILSNLPVKRVAVHKLPDWENNPVREILETEIMINDIPVVLFNCHWKSKSGGAEHTEPARLAASGTLKDRVAVLQKTRPGLRILITGDLNERHDEYELIKSAYQTALLPSSVSLPDSFQAESIFQTGDLNETDLAENKLTAFQPWYTVDSSPAGSYVFSKHWETIDHIMLIGNFSEESTLKFQRFFVHSASALVWEDSGFPRTWSVKHPDTGASDHLPVIMQLEVK